MKILLVSSYLPYPLFSGGNIRLYNILKQLSQKHQITLICEKRNYQTKADVEHVAQFCQKITTIPRNKQWSLTNIIKTGFSPYPFLMVGHTLAQMRKAITDELKKEDFDLIHVETFYVMQNLPRLNRGLPPLVLAEQNIEYMVYQRFAKQAIFFLKPLLYLDILKMKYWEKKFWRKAARLIAVSSEEKAFMERKDVAVVPNGVDIDKFIIHNSRFRKGKQERKILFIGDFRWVQNKDAALWILKEIWPAINRKWKMENKQSLRSGELGKLSLWIVGREIPESIKKLGGDNVSFDENAPQQTSEIFARADILLAPIRVGGGTSFKILEAMAANVPVVTSSIGIEGIEARDGVEVLIGKSAQELVDKTIEILQNKAIYQDLSQNARRLIEEKYDWKLIVKKLEEVYQSAVHYD